MDMKQKPAEMPFFVRQAGLEPYGKEGKGAITGYKTQEMAEANANERNAKAKEMGLKARYEVVKNNS